MWRRFMRGSPERFFGPGRAVFDSPQSPVGARYTPRPMRASDVRREVYRPRPLSQPIVWAAFQGACGSNVALGAGTFDHAHDLLQHIQIVLTRAIARMHSFSAKA